MSAAQEQPTDPDTGLTIAEGWQQVRQTCTRCHTSQIIIQNSGNREVWLSRIRWMQDTQGLEELPAELEDRILSYLVHNYGPKPPSRRAPLAPSLMPDPS
jgi:hypothetical protein